MYSFDINDWPNRVCFGADKVATLPELMDDLGARRALVVCGQTVAGGEMLTRVREALDQRCAGLGVAGHLTTSKSPSYKPIP